MKRKYRLAVFIGRFQPFHIGHEHVIKKALEFADQVLVIVGSAHIAPSPKNPFSFQQRYEMIERFGQAADIDSAIGIVAVNDTSDAEWIAAVQNRVREFATDEKDSEIVLVGHEKDASSFYLKIFPQWHFIDIPPLQIQGSRCIDATRIREMMFRNEWAFIQGTVSPAVFEYLGWWKETPQFQQLRDEWQYIAGYKASWQAAPYPPVFVTADSVVLQSGHILVVERGQAPGKGLMALPGGFVGQDERIVDAAIRELIEETGIKLQPQVLMRCISDVKVFDDPSRSLRGRTITHAHLIRLDDTRPLPPLRGGDDASDAMWIPLADAYNHRTLFFEDHFEIIRSMTCNI